MLDDSAVEDVMVADVPAKFNWHSALPEGVTDIEAVLYYRAPIDEAQAPEAQASGSEVVAEAAPEAALEPETVAPPATPPLEEEVPPPPPPFVDADDGAEAGGSVI